MNITEIRVKIVDDPQERLRAFCSVTLDKCFVVRDLKVISGEQGLFVAMPSRKLTDRCPDCGNKNGLRANFCEQCGVALGSDRARREDTGRVKLYADIAHPINARCREELQTAVVDAFEKELILAKEPGYSCRYDDYGEDSVATLASQDSSSQRAKDRSTSFGVGQQLRYPASGEP